MFALIQYDAFPSLIFSKKFHTFGTNNNIHHIVGHTIPTSFFQVTPLGTLRIVNNAMLVIL